MTTPALEEPPRVHGRHRDRALAKRRANRCLELVSQGLTYQEVADRLGYASRGTVHRIVHKSLDQQQVDDIAFLRRLESDRLDALQLALWPRAMSGDVAAVRACLRVLETRARLNGLLLSRQVSPFQCKQPQTVVLQEDDCRLRGCPTHT